MGVGRGVDCVQEVERAQAQSADLFGEEAGVYSLLRGEGWAVLALLGLSEKAHEKGRTQVSIFIEDKRSIWEDGF